MIQPDFVVLDNGDKLYIFVTRRPEIDGKYEMMGVYNCPGHEYPMYLACAYDKYTEVEHKEFCEIARLAGNRLLKDDEKPMDVRQGDRTILSN